MAEEWNKIIEKAFSEAVNLEHSASYYYLSVGAHFDSPKIALLNLKKMFYLESDEELEHAKILIKFMNRRGFKWTRMPIETVDPSAFSLVDIFQKSTEFEQRVLDNFLKIQQHASDADDFETTQFIDDFIAKQIKEVKEHGDRERSARRCTTPFEEFMLDESYKGYKIYK